MLHALPLQVASPGSPKKLLGTYVLLFPYTNRTTCHRHPTLAEIQFGSFAVHYCKLSEHLGFQIYCGELVRCQAVCQVGEAFADQYGGQYIGAAAFAMLLTRSEYPALDMGAAITAVQPRGAKSYHTQLFSSRRKIIVRPRHKEERRNGL